MTWSVSIRWQLYVMIFLFTGYLGVFRNIPLA